MFKEDQRKRKSDFGESEALEKKQRVESLVTALTKGDRKNVGNNETEKIVSLKFLFS